MKRHGVGPGASRGVREAYGPVHPGLARRNNRWTPARLEALRRLYAAGASLEEIGLSCGLRPGSVANLAHRHGWQRSKAKRLQWARHRWRLDRAMAGGGGAGDSDGDDGDGGDGASVSPYEQEFNYRLAQTIRAFWLAQGRLVRLSLRPQPGGVLGIRSDCVNGTAVRRAPAAVEDGW